MAVSILFVVIIAGSLLMDVTSWNLTCYSCNTTTEQDICYTNVTAAPIQVCDPAVSSMACSVYREDVAGKFTYISRGCNASCVEKCGAWGDEVDIDKCSSCCTSNVCNVDDAASSPWTATTTTTTVMMMMTMMMTMLWAVIFDVVLL